MSHRRLWTVALLAAMLLLAACGGGTSGGTDTPPAGGTGGSEPSGEEAPSQVVVGIDADTRALDPLTPLDATTTRILRNVYESLFFRTTDGELVPWLAESGDFSGNQWTIRLRQGITFHSGAELTAEAVKANLDYILDPDNAAGTQTLIPDVTGVEVVDTYTLRITTAEPNPDLAAQLTDVLIADPSVFAEAGAEALNENPVGTGPYRVERWQRDTELVLAAYEGYWQGRPAIDRVIFRVIPDTQARLAALLNGEVDLVPGVPPEMIAQIEADPAVRIEEVPGRQVIYVGMNLMRPGPLSDRRVRQALNYAVDADLIIDTILEGHATRNAAGLTAINAAYDPAIEPYRHDPERARQLLAEAGYAGGLTLDFHTPQGRYLKDYEAAQELARQLEAVGIRTNLQTHEWGTFLEMARSHTITDLYLIGLSDRTFAASQIDYLFHSGRTWVAFEDAEVDAAIERALAATDAAERSRLLSEASRLVQDYAPWIFLWQQHDIYGVSERLQWRARPDQQLFMFEASVR